MGRLLHNLGADAEPWRSDEEGETIFEECLGWGRWRQLHQQQTENKFVLIDDVPTGCQCFSYSDEHINVDRPAPGAAHVLRRRRCLTESPLLCFLIKKQIQ